MDHIGIDVHKRESQIPLLGDEILMIVVVCPVIETLMQHWIKVIHRAKSKRKTRYCQDTNTPCFIGRRSTLLYVQSSSDSHSPASTCALSPCHISMFPGLSQRPPYLEG
jgi:hypothetical protein